VLLGGLEESTPQEHSMSDTYQSLSHARWNCKCPVVFVPKRRRKTLYGKHRHDILFHQWELKPTGLS
jgi:hypothetical protein